jgi:hypothetical protein
LGHETASLRRYVSMFRHTRRGKKNSPPCCPATLVRPPWVQNPSAPPDIARPSAVPGNLSIGGGNTPHGVRTRDRLTALVTGSATWDSSSTMYLHRKSKSWKSKKSLLKSLTCTKYWHLLIIQIWDQSLTRYHWLPLPFPLCTARWLQPSPSVSNWT